jgi:hypothetical protein
MMTSSLKAYMPSLAWRLGTTAAALYERQRALVRGGILEQSEGRGPGSGVHLDPHAVALLLLAVLATDSLSETAEKVTVFAKARSTMPDHRCPLTAASHFAEAIACTLDPSRRHSSEISSIKVSRTSGSGVIEYIRKGRKIVSQFIVSAPLRADLEVTTRLLVEAKIQGDLIGAISADLQ